MLRILALVVCLWLVLGHSADAAGKHTPSVQSLFRRAGSIVRGRVLFTGASPLEADGVPSAGSAMTARRGRSLAFRLRQPADQW
jgi:hypothetical protein